MSGVGDRDRERDREEGGASRRNSTSSSGETSLGSMRPLSNAISVVSHSDLVSNTRIICATNSVEH